ncbi:MAG: asparagine synthase (glutamine-hydrolyzing) [Anaerolineales bacterium]|nr:asparagine synthase (glutamine-hydrolyzing) [Anaerolineales bacterium]
MCGIAGLLNLREAAPPALEVGLAQLATLRHRGPDGFGLYRDPDVLLGNARLSIVDLAGGDQPIGNEDGTVWVVFNGEIFNHVELRAQLVARGHRFATHCDTEVIVHLYEDFGPDCLQHLNGQFAIALWDRRAQALFLARDRLGVRPLHYTVNAGRLVFGSEVKALLAVPGVSAVIDPAALDETFVYWSVQPPRSIFKDVAQIPPGHFLLARAGSFMVQAYEGLDLAPELPARSTGEYLEALEALLDDAVRIRLRADVPVGSYLSGGLDSSLIAAFARRHTPRLETFSIAFEDQAFDESGFQQAMAEALGTRHHVVRATDADIGRVFPDVVWHTEAPVLRTAPAPMYLLAGLAHAHGFKVVLTGEGADELFGGYDIFKEAAVRRFWARQPGSTLRPALLHRLYTDIAGLGKTSDAFLKAFFGKGLLDTAAPDYSHRIRWSDAARFRRSFLLAEPAPPPPPVLPPAFATWPALAQAQYLEIATFLSPYLLSSQGDRVALAHSIEGRFPFLDRRVVAFANRLPVEQKLLGLREKWLLHQLGRRHLPDAIWSRPKRPYRAPIQHSFFHDQAPHYVGEVLGPDAIAAAGLFNATAVAQLVHKAGHAPRLSEVEEMLLVGILSTQLLHRAFVADRRAPDVRALPPLKCVDAVPAA